MVGLGLVLGLWPLGRVAGEPAPGGAAAISVPAALARLAGEPTPAVTPLGQLRPRRLDYLSLAALVPVGPVWRNLEANSEQRQPLHLGASPREQALHGQTTPQPRLPLPLKALAESQLPRLRQRLGLTQAEFEAWPTQNDVGRLTWVVSRWRPQGDAPWQWLQAPTPSGEPADPNLSAEPALILPERLEPAKASDLALLVDDFLLAPNLYTKPRFSECVWTRGGGELGLRAFAPSRELSAQRRFLRAASLADKQALHCLAMPPPPRFHEHALTFVLRVTPRGSLLWPDAIEWLAPPMIPALEPVLGAAVQLPHFPATFVDDYRADVQALAGATPLGPGRPPLWLRRKNSADPQHQLGALGRFLEARYQKLGLTVQHQRFTWRGVPQENLIAVLRGTRVTGNRPVLLADHIDTALCEDVFTATGQRVSAAGADDNVTAVATLLGAAEVLRRLPRAHDIWLVHLTGEEYPADDLGARQLVSDLLRRRVDIAALVLLDMIGHPPTVSTRRGRQFQINAGGLFESGATAMRLGQLARTLSGQVAPNLSPLLLPSTDLRNYLYNTDGLIFAEAGFPVVFFNEVMNRYNLTRSGYHDLHDTVANVDFDYAADIAKVAITTAAVLAQQGLP